MILCGFIGSYHPLLGCLALLAYVTVGVIVPLVTSRLSSDNGLRFRTESGAENYATVASVIQTAVKNGQNPFEVLRGIAALALA